MTLLTDEEAEDLATRCPPHKIIIDGNGLIGIVNAACTIAYKVDEVIEDDETANLIAHDLGMAMHAAEKEIGSLLKALTARVVEVEYGGKKP